MAVFPLFEHPDDLRSLINFRDPDWFDQYLEFRRQFALALDIPDPRRFGFSAAQLEALSSLRHPLYTMLLHSGLIYGFPFVYPFKLPAGLKKEPEWQTELVMVDMLLYTTLEALGATNPELVYTEKLERAGALIKGYYKGILSVQSTQSKRSIEQVLTHRVRFHRNWLDWQKTGINPHLFWDWFFFREYLEVAMGQPDRQVGFSFQELVEEKKSMKWLTMRLIAAAAHSDQKISRREEVLQHHFQKSIQFFSKSELERLQQIFDSGLSLDAVNFPDSDWVARRYWLDISLLVLYADKEIDDVEDDFLHRLCQRLSLTDQDLMESKLALGGFLLRFGRKMPFMSGRRSSLALIGQALSQNFSRLHQATHAEYKETLDMGITLGRLMQHQLGFGKGKELPSEEEIAAALDQMKDLPKFLPFFTVFFVPVPGITELYILLAYSIERLSGNTVRLLPSHFSKMVKKGKH